MHKMHALEENERATQNWRLLQRASDRCSARRAAADAYKFEKRGKKRRVRQTARFGGLEEERESPRALSRIAQIDESTRRQKSLKRWRAVAATAATVAAAERRR